jgi:hypothetical protein
MTQLPAEVFQAIAQFLAANKTGRITLNVKCGEIERWELREAFSRRSNRREWVDSGGSAGVFETNGMHRQT